MTHSSALSLIFVSALLASVRSQQSIVSTNTATVNGAFTVSCDASRVVIPESYLVIDALTIYRKVSQASDYSLVTSYNARPYPGQQEIIKNFTSQTWNVSAIGANNGASNQNTMKLVLNINDVVCTDAGMYRCVVRYVTPTALKDMPAQDQNVTVLSAPQKIGFNVQRYPTYDPFNPNNNNGAENYTLTCSIQGPQSVTLQWRSMSAHENLDYPVNSGFTTDSPVLIPGSSCQEYSQKTTLTVQNTNLMYDTMYICVASFQGQEAGRDNYTVPALTGTNGDAEATTAGSDGNIGMIVGIVVGCVVLIVIIIVVIILVLRRKKRAKEGSYKANQDHPDGTTDSGLHAPPPVFVTKPSKGPNYENEKTQADNSKQELARYDDYDNSHGRKGKPYDRSPYYDNNYNFDEEPSGIKSHRSYPSHDNHRRPQEQHYASTDVSQSGEESADQSDVPLEKSRSKPKPRSRSQGRQRGNREGSQPLHYAELDLPSKNNGSKSGSDVGQRRPEKTVEYAEIRV